MSEHKRNYDILKGILSGKQVNTLTSQELQSIILGKAAFSVKDSKWLYVLHDGYDIGKPSSIDMEYLSDRRCGERFST
jgi:uncharacterized protein YgfB (UPF0149 family)